MLWSTVPDFTRCENSSLSSATWRFESARFTRTTKVSPMYRELW